MAVFQFLGPGGPFSVQTNSIGCRVCRPGYLEVLKGYYANRLTGLCPDCQTRFEKNPLRLLDCKKPSCYDVAEAAPKSADYLCPECRGHFEAVLKYLDALNLPYNINHRLVRGLDYYTKTVFEIQPPGEGAQSASAAADGTMILSGAGR